MGKGRAPKSKEYYGDDKQKHLTFKEFEELWNSFSPDREFTKRRWLESEHKAYWDSLKGKK